MNKYKRPKEYYTKEITRYKQDVYHSEHHIYLDVKFVCSRLIAYTVCLDTYAQSVVYFKV